MRRIRRGSRLGQPALSMVVAALLLAVGSVSAVGAVRANAATAPGPLPVAGLPNPSEQGSIATGRTVTGGNARSGVAPSQMPSAGADAQCVFLTQDTCTSSDPSVTVETYSSGDTSDCTFGGTIDWGDGSAPQNVGFTGGPDGTIFNLGSHAYKTPATYTITVAGEVLSGDCTWGTGTAQFTLSSLITSPAAGAIIALTDPAYLSPQPTDVQRAPATRDLTVTGVDPCGCGVTVNSVAATVAGATWQASIPVSAPGPLTLTVDTSAGEHDSADITLIDLRVAGPAENAKLPLTADPAMPKLDARVEIAGLPADQDPSGITVRWTLQMINRYVVPKNRWLDDVRTVATGTTSGIAAAWQLPADTPVVGGWGRLTATADIAGVADPTVTSEPRWIDIPGTNPGQSAVAAYLADHAGADAGALTHIACHESGRTFDQFRETAQSLTIRYKGQQIAVPAASDKIPDGWPNPAPLRPLFGYPSGVGIMQLDPASYPAQQWDWQANVLGGIGVYAGKQKLAAAWPPKQQKVIDAVRDSDLKIVNAARKAKGLAPITVTRVIVTPYTAAQLTDDTIRGYNGYGKPAKYHQFTFDPRYTMSADHLHLTIDGTPDWVKTVIPDAFNPDYVATVLACG